MNAIKPELHLSVFGRKKKVTPDTPSTDEIIDHTINSVQQVAVDTVAIAEEAGNRMVVKLIVGGIVGGLILIAANTFGNILTNTLDKTPTTD